MQYITQLVSKQLNSTLKGSNTPFMVLQSCLYFQSISWISFEKKIEQNMKTQNGSWGKSSIHTNIYYAHW